jgi:hypothetical protein
MIDKLKKVAELRRLATAGEWKITDGIESLIRCGNPLRGPVILCAAEDGMADIENAAFIAAAANLDFDALAGELDAANRSADMWRDKYFREVEGLNNEGDPIGGMVIVPREPSEVIGAEDGFEGLGFEKACE